MADVSSTLAAWSSTTASNNPAGSTSIGTGLDDNLREIQGVIVRGLSHKGADIASVAGTMDIGAVEGVMHDITGALAITGLGTVRAGIWKILKFEAAATLTHNATSLILPGAANITTADGDIGIFISEGSGNWRCVSYSPSAQAPYAAGSWTPVLTFATAGDLSVAYTTQVGRYTKVGNLCAVHLTIVTSGFTHTTASGQLRITGLPFTAANVSGLSGGGAMYWQGITKANYTQMTAVSVANQTYLNVVGSGSAQNAATLGTGDMPSGGTVNFVGSLTYQTA